MVEVVRLPIDQIILIQLLIFSSINMNSRLIESFLPFIFSMISLIILLLLNRLHDFLVVKQFDTFDIVQSNIIKSKLTSH